MTKIIIIFTFLQANSSIHLNFQLYWKTWASTDKLNWTSKNNVHHFFLWSMNTLHRDPIVQIWQKKKKTHTKRKNTLCTSFITYKCFLCTYLYQYTWIIAHKQRNDSPPSQFKSLCSVFYNAITQVSLMKPKNTSEQGRITFHNNKTLRVRW